MKYLSVTNRQKYVLAIRITIKQKQNVNIFINIIVVNFIHNLLLNSNATFFSRLMCKRIYLECSEMRNCFLKTTVSSPKDG